VSHDLELGGVPAREVKKNTFFHCFFVVLKRFLWPLLLLLNACFDCLKQIDTLNDYIKRVFNVVKHKL